MKTEEDKNLILMSYFRQKITTNFDKVLPLYDRILYNIIIKIFFSKRKGMKGEADKDSSGR